MTDVRVENLGILIILKNKILNQFANRQKYMNKETRLKV